MDHPRIRGEHREAIRNTSNSLGSSPHTRGALDDSDQYSIDGRIIPAYAGSTPCGTVFREEHWDHPRIRGEHPVRVHHGAGFGGSSPHTRGAHQDPRRQPRHGRIIPAYAGSTAGPAGSGYFDEDHPRIRGEHHQTGKGSMHIDGSSPHTRGARPAPVHQHVPDGIIPAYAGSTQILTIPGDTLEGSSPHTRGAPPWPLGQLGWLRIIPAYAGSTEANSLDGQTMADHPRIRGEHLCGAGGRRTGPRIIPAYAGSTSTRAPPTGSPKDHPRIRGEHDVYDMVTARGRGSSPHTRGAPPQLVDESARSRIIPAYAGSTAARTPAKPESSDHPRIRGEHTVAQSASGHGSGSSPHTRGALVGASELEISRHGSSPHTRGAPRRSLRRPGRRGIIPAYAGSTACTAIFAPPQGDHPRIRGEHQSFV